VLNRATILKSKSIWISICTIFIFTDKLYSQRVNEYFAGPVAIKIDPNTEVDGLVVEGARYSGLNSFLDNAGRITHSTIRGVQEDRREGRNHIMIDHMFIKQINPRLPQKK